MPDWFVNPNHGLLLLRSLAILKSRLAVTIQEPADPHLPPKLLASGHIDLAVYYQPSLIQAVARGLPLAWAGTLISTPLDGVIILEESEIKLSGLKRKIDRVSIGGLEHAKLDILLKPYGFSTKDVNLLRSWNLPMSTTKRVDAIIRVSKLRA